MNIKDLPVRFAQMPRNSRYLTAGGAAVTVTLLILWLTGSGTTVTFHTYTSNQGAFTVEVPAESMALTIDPFTFLDQKVSRFTHEADAAGGTFRVIHFDLPQGMITPPETNNILNALAASFILPVNGVINTSSEITVQGYGGISITANGSSEDQATEAGAMIIIVSNRVYMAGWHAPRKELKKKYRDHFFSSFRLNF